MVPEEYGDCHRFFLQEMMSVGILGTYQVQDLFDRSHKAFDEEKGELLPFIKAIQAKIRPMGMMIRKWTDEDGWRKNKNTYYVLTCTTERSNVEFPMLANRAMPDFTPAEIVFMKQMVDEILLSDLKEISRQAALLIVPRVKAALSGNKQFTMSEAEKSISAFVSRKWLKFDSEKKNIRLTPRFLAEMQTYLHKLRSQAEELEDEDHPGAGVKVCPAPGCNQIVIRSFQCDRCKEHFHLYCVADQQGTGKETRGRCPKCQSETVRLRESSSSKGKGVGKSSRSESSRHDSSRGESSRQDMSRGESSRRRDMSRGESSRQDTSRRDTSRGESSRQDTSRRDSSRGESSRGARSQEAVKRKRISRPAASSSSDEEM